MTGAGRRDQRIGFERDQAGSSALGGPAAADWQALGTRWALVLFGTGSERRAAGVEQAVQAAIFRVVADSLTRTVTVRDRIVHAGLAWDIAGIAPIGRGPAEIEFTATASRG